jgi:hypothetical protein
LLAAAELPKRVVLASGREQPMEAERLTVAELTGAARRELEQRQARSAFQVWELFPEAHPKQAGHRVGQRQEAWDGRATSDGPAVRQHLPARHRR